MITFYEYQIIGAENIKVERGKDSFCKGYHLVRDIFTSYLLSVWVCMCVWWGWG